MGCIHSLDQSLSENAINTKHDDHHPHKRCATNPPPSESTPSLHNRNASGIIHYKPREINIEMHQNNNTAHAYCDASEMLVNDDPSHDIELPLAQNTNDLKNKMRRLMFTNSNSLRSVISNTATTLDGNISSHIQQNSRITLNYTIEEDISLDSHRISPNQSCNHSPNQSALHSPLAPLPMPLMLENHLSNVSIGRASPIFAYKKRTPSIKRSKSVDPHPNNNNKLNKTRKRHTRSNTNKYAYTQHKNAKLNTTKSKRRLVHAKSKSIPYNIFSSDLHKYQNEETDNYHYLSQITHFDTNTLRLLHLRFNHIYLMSCYQMDVHEVTTISHKMKLDLSSISEIFGLPSHCILVQRFFWYMDQHDLGELSFRVFARLVSVLSDKASIAEKCELSFNIYDLNNDSVLDHNELKQLIYDMIHYGKHLMDPLLIQLINDETSDFINTLINNTMKEFDLDANGNITYAAYCSFMERNPRLLSPFTLDVEKLLDFEAEKRRMHRISLESLKKKQLRQLVIGIDPKLKYNKKWKKPQFIKDMGKDEIHRVNSIKSAQQICQDLFDVRDDDLVAGITPSPTTDSEKEREKEERLQNTIEFLYDD